MKEFMYCFQLDKLTVFEVCYYTLSTNSTADFTITAARFSRSKRDYNWYGREREIIPSKHQEALHFYDRWERLHLHKLTLEEYKEIAADIETLKVKYNYIEDVRDCFGKSAGCEKTGFSFSEIVELSKLKPKEKKKSA